MSKDGDTEDILKSAGVGALTGTALAGAGELIGGAVRGARRLFTSKTAQELEQMARDPGITSKDVRKLSVKEQEQYYKSKTQAVQEISH